MPSRNRSGKWERHRNRTTRLASERQVCAEGGLKRRPVPPPPHQHTPALQLGKERCKQVFE